MHTNKGIVQRSRIKWTEKQNKRGHTASVTTGKDKDRNWGYMHSSWSPKQ